MQKLRIDRLWDAVLSDRSFLSTTLFKRYDLANQTHLKVVELVFNEGQLTRILRDEGDLEPYFANFARRIWERLGGQACAWELARRLKTQGVRLAIRAICSKGFIPPYMYGEELPTESVVYDSDQYS